MEQFQEPYSGHENESHTLRMMEQKKTQGNLEDDGNIFNGSDFMANTHDKTHHSEHLE